MPSVVFAEAGWYGSLRSGLQFGGGEDGKLVDAYSRFGIKGSNEVSDGLSAVYRFETKINTTNANLDGGRLSYVGLSGGFGTITIGQIWGASYNHAGAVFDLANYGGGHNTSGRVGNALSYSISTGSVSAQIDAIMDGGTDSSGGGIDQFEFGLSFDMGDIGKIALAHSNVRDVNMSKMADLTPSTINVSGGTNETYRVTLEGAGATAKIKKEGVWRDKTTREIVDNPTIKVKHVYDVNTADGAHAASDLKPVTPIIVYSTSDLTAATDVKLIGGKYYNADTAVCPVATAATACTNAQLMWLHKRNVETKAGENPDPKTPALTAYVDPASGGTTSVTHTATATVTDVTPGHKTTNLAVQFNLGAITAHLGTSQIKMNNMEKKTKVTHFGVNGGLGDTGMSFYAAGRNIKPADSMEMKSTPWVIGLNRSLGDGAKVWLEHENLDNGKSGTTTVGLNVNF